MSHTRPITFDISLRWALDKKGVPGLLGKCAPVDVHCRGASSDEVLAEVQALGVKVLTGWLQAGELPSQLLRRGYTRPEDMLQSEGRVEALLNGAGARFLRKRERDLDYSRSCWAWTGASSGTVYPQPKFSLGGTCVVARRVALELEYGPLPGGLVVFNSCGGPLCVTPKHQSLRPAKWLVQWPGRPRGVFSPRAQINFKIAQEIRELYLSNPRGKRGGGGVSMQELANKYGISVSTVRQIVEGQTWRQPD